MSDWLQILNFTRAIKKEKNNKIKLKRDDSKFERSNKWMERWRTHQAFSLRNSRTLPRSHNPTVGTTLAPFTFRGRSHTWYFPFFFSLFLTCLSFSKIFYPTRKWDGDTRSIGGEVLTWWIMTTAAARDWRENFYYCYKKKSL